jgi:HSP20 family protein
MARNPFEDLERMFDRMTRQFEGLEPGMERHFARGLAVDVEDRDDEYVVTADVPGFDREDIEVKLSGDTLTIQAEHSEELEEEEGEGRYLRRERSQRSVRRSVHLPDPVEEDATNADYAHGVLTVTLPKRDAGDDGTDIPIN